MEESGLNVHKCTVCCYEFNSLRALRTHSTKVHTCSVTVRQTVQPPSDLQCEVNTQDSASCSAGDEVFMSLRDLRLHQFWSHKVAGRH